MDKKGRILTGHRPSGPRHLGHPVGTLETWVKLQDAYECFFLVADLHTLTTDFEHPEKVSGNILEMLADWLADGIDPVRSRMIRQSSLPQHAELAILLGNLVRVSRLDRVPTYKEQVKQIGVDPTAGLFTYPILQRADIFLYKATTIPVGEDQLPHLELSRELARRFNQLYGMTFAEPEAIQSNTLRLPGLDNRTMHTSYRNTIAPGDSSEVTNRKVMNMFTDPNRIHPDVPGHVQGNPVFVYHDIFNPNKEEVEEFKRRYHSGKVGDVEIKQRLAVVINEYLEPLRDRRERFLHQPGLLVEILYDGTSAVRPIAQAAIEEVKQKKGLSLGIAQHRLS